MIKILRAAAAMSFAGATMAVLAGCPAAGIPGLTGASTMPGGSADPGAAASCTRTEPSMPKITGNASMGDYNGQGLPNGWDTYKSEADVTAAIKKMDGGTDWACFQKFYPGATTVYMKKK